MQHEEPGVNHHQLATRHVISREGDRGGRQYWSIIRPLELYEHRAYISDKQYRAGKKLHELWWQGCAASGFVQMQYRETNGGGRPTAFTPQGFLATEYREAMVAIGGLKRRRVAYKVCCDELFAGRGAAMIHLKDALDDLSKHFGY